MLGPLLIGIGIALAVHDHLTQRRQASEVIPEDGGNRASGDHPGGQHRGDTPIHGDRRLSVIPTKEAKADDGKPDEQGKSGLSDNGDSDHSRGEPDGPSGNGQAEAVTPETVAPETKKKGKTNVGSPDEKPGNDGASNDGNDVSS